VVRVWAVKRAEMRQSLLGDFDWFDWSGELVAVGLAALVVADVAPAWALLIALPFILRPLGRVAVRIAARLFDL